MTVDYGEQSFNKSFGERVREARDKLEWSQRKLAEALEGFDLKLDPSAVTRIERGTREVKLREATAIAAALGVSLQDLTPSPASTPREQFDACLQIAAQHGGAARQSLALMAVQVTLALHLLDHHPDLVEEYLSATPRDLGEGVVEAFRQVVSKSPAGVAASAEQADLLNAVVAAVVSNLIGVDEAVSDGDGDGNAET